MTWGCQPRPMLGRLPWFALLRRIFAFFFLVFFDIRLRAYRPRRQARHAASWPVSFSARRVPNGCSTRNSLLDHTGRPTGESCGRGPTARSSTAPARRSADGCLACGGDVPWRTIVRVGVRGAGHDLPGGGRHGHRSRHHVDRGRRVLRRRAVPCRPPVESRLGGTARRGHRAGGHRRARARPSGLVALFIMPIRTQLVAIVDRPAGHRAGRRQRARAGGRLVDRLGLVGYVQDHQQELQDAGDRLTGSPFEWRNGRWGGSSRSSRCVLLTILMLSQSQVIARHGARSGALPHREPVAAPRRKPPTPSSGYMIGNVLISLIAGVRRVRLHGRLRRAERTGAAPARGLHRPDPAGRCDHRRRGLHHRRSLARTAHRADRARLLHRVPADRELRHLPSVMAVPSR